jgi:uncharacterized protein involved in exopolysaccharide biosynthesis
VRANWRLFCAWTAIGSAVGFLAWLLLPPAFTAQGSFIVEQRSVARGGSSLTALAGELGLGGGGGTATGPQYFADLLRARSIQSEVVRRVIPVGLASDSQRVEDLLASGESAGLKREARARERLNAALSVNANPRTGVISFDVTARDPRAAAAIANLFLEQLNRFVMVTRQSSARAQREFAERRLHDASDSLARAEDQGLRFLLTNREWKSAPQLVFRYEQLQRQIATYQQLLISIRQQYEAARIEEVNDTPQITVLDPPLVPLWRTAPRLRATVGIGLLLGLAVAVVLVSQGGRRSEIEADESD